VTTNHPGQADRPLHFTIPHSFVIQTAAYAVMLLLMMGMMNVRKMLFLEIKAKIQLHLVGYIYTYLNTMHGTMNLNKKAPVFDALNWHRRSS
jgi:hypothetical protein